MMKGEPWSFFKVCFGESDHVFVAGNVGAIERKHGTTRFCLHNSKPIYLCIYIYVLVRTSSYPVEEYLVISVRIVVYGLNLSDDTQKLHYWTKATSLALLSGLMGRILPRSSICPRGQDKFTDTY